MRNKKWTVNSIKLFLIVINCVLLAAMLSATAARADINAVMNNGVGARGPAMGFAQVSNSTGVDSIFWNPAAIIEDDDLEISTHSSDIFGTSYKTIGGIFDLFGERWGLLVLRADQGNILETALDPNGRPAATGNAFNYNATAVFLSYARRTAGLDWGLNLKYLAEGLQDASAAGLALDLGLRAEPTPKLALGFKLENLVSSPYKWNSASGAMENLPVKARIGATLFPAGERFALNCDLGIVSAGNPEIYTGGEYRISQNLSLRLGSSCGRLSGGVGIKYKGLTADYSYGRGSDFLEDAQRISLSFTFWENRSYAAPILSMKPDHLKT